MRKVFNSVSFAILLGQFLLVMCAKPSKEDEQIEWKQMDDFHAVMADVYHPLKDSGNLAPIKSRAEELATSASAWADATLPEKVDNEEVKGLLIKLKDGTRGLADQIKAGAADDVIQSQLTSLHDLFHALQEKWYQAGDGEEGHEDHH